MRQGHFRVSGFFSGILMRLFISKLQTIWAVLIGRPTPFELKIKEVVSQRLDEARKIRNRYYHFQFGFKLPNAGPDKYIHQNEGEISVLEKLLKEFKNGIPNA